LKIVFNSSRGAQIIGGRLPVGLYFVQQCPDFGGPQCGTSFTAHNRHIEF